MILKYFYDATLAQASYLVGCAEQGEAAIVDPAREIEPYLRVAENEGLRITHVVETHIHADFVSGSREVAAHTGACIHVSDMGDAQWKYSFAHEPNVNLVRDGDTLMVGNVRLQALHTPGHTPEHLSYVLTDTKTSQQPMGIFSGDFVFAGDVGRPDLLESAAGQRGTKEIGARQLFESLQTIKNFPGHLQIWPGHGAGSACGKSLGAVPSTTLGYEMLTSPAFQFEDKEEFSQWLLEGQPEAPRYFAQMKKVNKEGPVLLRQLDPPALLNHAAFVDLVQQGAQIFDLRSGAHSREQFVPGTLNVPASGRTFTTYVGWFVDYDQPLYLILPAAGQEAAEEMLPEIVTALQAIGVDDIGGYFYASVVEESDCQPGLARIPTVRAPAVAAAYCQDETVILDVRGQNEVEEQRIRGALAIPLGYLPQEKEQVPRERPVFVHCATGYRSQIAASLLHTYGFDNVTLINDTFDNLARRLPTESDAGEDAGR